MGVRWESKELESEELLVGSRFLFKLMAGIINLGFSWAIIGFWDLFENDFVLTAGFYFVKLRYPYILRFD